LRLLIGGSSSKFFHLNDFTAELENLGIKCKLVHDTDFADGYPSRKLSTWLKRNKKIENFLKDAKIQQLESMIRAFKLEVKVAIPNSEFVDGVFEERLGIFRDTNDDVVAFSGTSNVTFDAENRNFESVDVFTSWDDKSRVDQKIKNFEDLWTNQTNFIQVYDLPYAERNNLLKYSTDWAIDKN